MKNNFIKSILILIFGGFLTKILGMIIKIVLTRTISLDGIAMYSLILPTFNLFITLSSMGLPIAIAKLVSEHKNNNKKIVLPTIPLIIIFNLLLIVIIFVIAPILSNNLLHNKDLYYPLIAIGLTLPFIGISSIIKGYFFGVERMWPNTLSNIVEQLMRLFLTMTVINKLMDYSLMVAITGVVLINILSEGISIVVLLLFIPKNKNIDVDDFKIDKSLLKDLLHISIPTTGSRLIGSVSYFLEPIILTFALSKAGYSNPYITLNYGIINGYVFPLLLLPSFFTLAISNALLPVISNSYSNRDYKYTKYKIKQGIFISLMVGIPCTCLFVFAPEFFLEFIYNTREGVEFVRVIAPIFILHYIQTPLTSCMQAMGYARDAMYGTIIGAILKNVSLLILSLFRIGIWGLIISSSINIVFITLHHLYFVFKVLKK